MKERSKGKKKRQIVIKNLSFAGYNVGYAFREDILT